MFANTDRHEYNFLVSGDSPPYSLHGIDNGCCLSESIKDPLVIELAAYEQLMKPFPAKALDLLAEEKISHYQATLKEHGFGGFSIKWLRLCGQLLEEGIKMQGNPEQGPHNLLTGSDIAVTIIKHRTTLCESDDPSKIFEDLIKAVIRAKDKIN